jgi:hypothetical protein
VMVAGLDPAARAADIDFRHEPLASTGRYFADGDACLYMGRGIACRKT